MDSVVATVDAALAKQGQTLEALERWKAEMPTEAEMLPKDKYTMFDRKEKRYRKGIHSRLCIAGMERVVLIGDRIAEVDESFAASQPSRLLRWMTGAMDLRIGVYLPRKGLQRTIRGSMYNTLFQLRICSML